MHSGRLIGTVVLFLLLVALVQIIVDNPPPVTTEPVLAYPDDDMPPPVADIKVREDLDKLWTNISIHLYNNVSYINEHGLTFLWNFGDDSEQTNDPNPIHVYGRPGIYTVTLVIYDIQSASGGDTLNIWVRDNYGDTEIIIKAIDPYSQRTFKDPVPDQLTSVAVQRGGWVAYLCEFKTDRGIKVKVTIIGDRPVDIFLFEEEGFQTYMNGPEVDFVRYEVKGTASGVTGEFNYTYRAERAGRYYVVIDNTDWPPGTNAEGPVDYTVSIEPLAYTGPPDDIWDRLGDLMCPTIGLVFLVAIIAVIISLRKALEEP